MLVSFKIEAYLIMSLFSMHGHWIGSNGIPFAFPPGVVIKVEDVRHTASAALSHFPEKGTDSFISLHLADRNTTTDWYYNKPVLLVQ